jgi:hypothetical protein
MQQAKGVTQNAEGKRPRAEGERQNTNTGVQPVLLRLEV